MTKLWGPNIWNFLHCFCEKIDNNFFINNKMSVFMFLNNILFNLPCPICSADSRAQFSKVNYNSITNKENLKKLLFYYHNYVNKKLRKKQKPISYLNVYKKYNIDKCYHNFKIVFFKKYSFKLNIYSKMLFNKNNEQNNVRLWWYRNRNNFINS